MNNCCATADVAENIGYTMTITISQIGSSQGVIFDAALLNRVGMKIGDQVEITVIPTNGAIVIDPIRKRSTKAKKRSLIRKSAK